MFKSKDPQKILKSILSILQPSDLKNELLKH